MVVTMVKLVEMMVEMSVETDRSTLVDTQTKRYCNYHYLIPQQVDR
jgi:hypothetical protein